MSESSHIILTDQEGKRHFFACVLTLSGEHVSTEEIEDCHHNGDNPQNGWKQVTIKAGSLMIIDHQNKTVSVVRDSDPVPAWYFPLGMAFVFTVTWAVQKTFGMI